MGTIQIDGSTPKLTIGNATAEDATILFDGNAQDFYIALDDSADDLLIGLGSTVGTTPAISIDENLAVKTYGDITMTGTTPVLTIGDAGAEDTAIVFDGNAQDFYIALDDSADDLVIGLGSTVGTTPAISINEDQDVTISDGAIDFDVASHDGTNGLKLGGTLVTTTAAELNLLDGGTSVGSSITVADADGFVVNDGGTMKTIPASDISTYAGGGKLLQVQHTNYTSQTSVADLDYVSTGVTCAITPSATDSKIFGLLKLHCRGHSVTSSDEWGYSCKVTRSGGAAGDVLEENASGSSFSTYFAHDSDTSFHFCFHSSYQFLDTSHATVSAITYTAYAKSMDVDENASFQNGSFPSQFTLMEISA